jgi:hypothetical protein
LIKPLVFVRLYWGGVLQVDTFTAERYFSRSDDHVFVGQGHSL